MALSNGYSGRGGRYLRVTSSDSTSTPRKTASGNSCKILREMQRSDQKLWPFRMGTLVAGDDTSASPRSDSTSTPRKTASGNSCKILREIQRSDQKLWPFQTGTLERGNDSSASPSSDSTSNPWKTASGNSCKILREIQRRNKSYGPFERVLWSRATIPPRHRAAIPHLVLGEGVRKLL
jgi:hypothetical protein